jgi:hypothetical protein
MGGAVTVIQAAFDSLVDDVERTESSEDQMCVAHSPKRRKVPSFGSKGAGLVRSTGVLGHSEFAAYLNVCVTNWNMLVTDTKRETNRRHSSGLTNFAIAFSSNITNSTIDDELKRRVCAQIGRSKASIICVVLRYIVYMKGQEQHKVC